MVKRKRGGAAALNKLSRMAAKGKRKRGLAALLEQDKVSRVRLGDYVTEFGIPELDKLMSGCQCRKSAPISTFLTKVPKIMEGHKVNNNRTEEEEEEDRISRLPDDILQFIISSLTLKEGVATSLLTTRWRYLWTASFSSLNFDIPNMLGPNYTERFYGRGKRFLSQERSKFATRVNHIFKLHRASRLDALRVSFGFGKESASHIDTWVESAAAKGVTDMELSFNLIKRNPYELDDRYEFPAQRLASSLKHLHLESCNFRLPPDFTGFPSLVTLSLMDIFLNQSVVDCILYNCPLLQFLSLGKSLCAIGTRLEFVGPPLLKHLCIGSAWGIEIVLRDVSLLSLELMGNVGKLSIKNAPHLARLMLGAPKPVEVLSDLPRLKTLFVTHLFKKSFMPMSSVLNNLKRVVFLAGTSSSNLLRVVSLLEACRLLQELEIDMGITESSRIRPLSDTMMKRFTTLAGSPHNYLKKIEIYGFHPLTKRIELVKYLLKYAIVLENMKIYTTSRLYHGNGKWSLYEGTAKRAMSLEEVYKMLQRVARSSTKLELFTSLSQSVTMPA